MREPKTLKERLNVYVLRRRPFLWDLEKNSLLHYRPKIETSVVWLARSLSLGFG